MTDALTGHEAFFSVTPLVENFVDAGTKAAQAAKAAGIKKIVRSSAQGASANAAIELGRMHYAVEKAIEDTGIAFAVVRPANFMQNYLTFGIPETIKSQSAFYASQGEAKVSVVDTRDISAVASKLLIESGHEGKRYDITGGESLSNYEIAELFSKALERKIRYVSVSQEKAEEGMMKAGMPTWLVRLISELGVIGAKGYLAEVRSDVEQLLKRKPINFAQFLNDNRSIFQ